MKDFHPQNHQDLETSDGHKLLIVAGRDSKKVSNIDKIGLLVRCWLKWARAKPEIAYRIYTSDYLSIRPEGVTFQEEENLNLPINPNKPTGLG